VLTVHRSQGSTFGEVFIDEDVFWPRDLALRQRLVYVAVSRASQAVTLMAAAADAGDRGHWDRWLRDTGDAAGSSGNGDAQQSPDPLPS
jgi:exodeoxyribonuclease-5